MASSATAGKHAVVEVETSDSSTFEPKALQVYGPSLICEAGEDQTGEDVEVLVIRESDVRRVRIYMASEDERTPVGFRVGEIDLG